ncbi:MAG: hypothetical protein ACREH4_07170 [Vitreimonas sp.]
MLSAAGPGPFDLCVGRLRDTRIVVAAGCAVVEAKFAAANRHDVAAVVALSDF